MKKVIFFLIALLIIISTAIFQKKLNNSKSETVTKYEKIDISPGEDIYTYKDYIYIYGKSGIKIYHNTNEIFTESFLMENIYTVSSNDKIILGDKQGKTLRIYNKKGNMYSINHTNPIISFTVNQNGYAAFIAKASSSYEILVYNDLGENIFSLTNITYKEGIPINLSLSKILLYNSLFTSLLISFIIPSLKSLGYKSKISEKISIAFLLLSLSKILNAFLANIYNLEWFSLLIISFLSKVNIPSSNISLKLIKGLFIFFMYDIKSCVIEIPTLPLTTLYKISELNSLDFSYTL